MVCWPATLPHVALLGWSSAVACLSSWTRTLKSTGLWPQRSGWPRQKACSSPRPSSLDDGLPQACGSCAALDGQGTRCISAWAAACGRASTTERLRTPASDRTRSLLSSSSPGRAHPVVRIRCGELFSAACVVLTPTLWCGALM